MSKVVCIKCQLFLELAVKGVTVEEMAHFGPYKLWRADVWRCPRCEVEIVTGFGDGPIAEHHQTEKFAALREAARILVEAFHNSR